MGTEVGSAPHGRKKTAPSPRKTTPGLVGAAEEGEPLKSSGSTGVMSLSRDSKETALEV